MTKGLLAALILFWTSFAAYGADPLLGWWRTPTEDHQYGHVEVYPCGADFCGTVRRGFDDQDREGTSPFVGREVLSQVQAAGDGTYTGRAYRPKNGKVYDVVLTLNGPRLEIKGCVAGGLFCSTTSWTRLP